MARRATDLFAIAIIFAAIMAISGRLAEWWGTSPDDVLRPDQSVAQIAGTQASWGAGETPVALRLGQLPLVMHRQVIVGNEERAAEVARRMCRDLLEKSARDSQLLPIADENISDILTRLKGLAPVEQSAGKWKLYRVDQPSSFVVGSLLIGVRASPNSKSTDDSELACWAMVVPQGNTQWTLFAFERTTKAAEATLKLPLPPDARSLLALADPSGGQLAAFESDLLDQSGDGVLIAKWCEFFDTELAKRQWQQVRDWSRNGDRLTARFEATGLACEIQLKMNDGKLAGLANVIPLIAPKSGSE